MPDFDPPAVCRETRPKTKRAYFCVDCGDVVPPGQVYRCISGLWDGQWESIRQCLFCAELAAELQEGHAFGELQDALAYEFSIDDAPAQRWIAHTGRNPWGGVRVA